VEPGFQAAVGAWGRGAPPPRSAHRAEPEVARDIVREEFPGDHRSAPPARPLGWPSPSCKPSHKESSYVGLGNRWEKCFSYMIMD
jgi:hypothetical protein